MAKSVVLSEELYRELQDLIRWKRDFRVTGAARFENKRQSCSIAIGRELVPPPPAFDRRIEFVKVTAAASGGGKYDGKLWRLPTTTPAATSNAAEADFGVESVTVLIFNAAEIGQSTHDLTTGTPINKIHVGILIGFTSGGIPVYGINGQDWENCT